jgi:ectoine hydroxylase-related dioxygenase (phytanoyl-CoA dioxygenase family)
MEHVENIRKNGYTILRQAVDHSLINTVRMEFDQWIAEHNFKTRDRVVSFHVYSKNTIELVTNPMIHEIVSLFFDKEQVVYSSLCFREGTMQDYHRDTPHFYTNPINQYCGVWYALEDIHADAGPLKYIIGSHNIDDPDGHEIFNQIKDKDLCFEKYNGQIKKECEEKMLTTVDEQNYNPINKGDIIIWHPKLLHGGSMVIDPRLTRYSMVTHNIPIDTQVYNSAHFFTEVPTQEYIKNKFNFQYIQQNNVNIVDHNVLPYIQTKYDV